MRANHEKVRRLIQTARGQLEGVLKMIDEDKYCIEISNQLQASMAVLRRANQEVIRGHIQGCVKEAIEGGNAEEKLDEVLAAIERMNK